MATHTWKPSFRTARRKVSFEQEKVLTRDGCILGELAYNFADLGGHKRITRKRQAIRNLRIKHSSFNDIAG